MKKNVLISSLLLSILVISPFGYSETIARGGMTYYLSPTGDDSKSGTSEAEAWATFDRAWQDVYPGDTLILLDGIYYQSLNPNVRNGEPGNPITIRAKNDGQAIIDGEYQRVPVKLGDTWPGPIGEYFAIEGIVARNSSGAVYQIVGDNNVLRRVSGYNANTDLNIHVFMIWADHNLLEDCIASGTGRKMVMSYKGDHNVIRRCFTYWQSWDGRKHSADWPWGNGIEIYFGDYNIIENGISYGPDPDAGIGIHANSRTDAAIGNQILGSISIYTGMNDDGTVKYWGCPEKPEPCGPEDRPQPTVYQGVTDFDGQGSMRSGFRLYGQGELRDNVFQDILAWSNAGLGFVYYPDPAGQHPDTRNNTVNRATLFNNGLDQPCTGAWPCRGGGIGTDVRQADISKPGLESITDSYIEKIFIDWPDYPNGSRNMTSMEGEGARLTHRYVNGVLTDEPLWPWPMEDRVQAELGLSVTDLVMDILAQAPGSGFGLNVSPRLQLVESGGAATFPIQVEHSQDFTSTVTLQVGPSPSPQLLVDLASPTSFPPPGGQTTLTLTDLHDPSFSSGLWYTVPITAGGGDITRTTSVALLVNGKRFFLPLVFK